MKMTDEIAWPPLPSNDEIQAMFAEAWRETAFWQENYERLPHEYPDQYVAVRDGEVIAVADDAWGIVAETDKLGLVWPDVWTSFVPREPIALML